MFVTSIARQIDIRIGKFLSRNAVVDDMFSEGSARAPSSCSVNELRRALAPRKLTTTMGTGMVVSSGGIDVELNVVMSNEEGG